MGPARIVDDDGELAARRLDEPRPVAAFGDVALHEAAADLLCHALALWIDVIHHHLGAFFCKATRDAGAEAGARTGNDRGLALEAHQPFSFAVKDGI